MGEHRAAEGPPSNARIGFWAACFTSALVVTVSLGPGSTESWPRTAGLCGWIFISASVLSQLADLLAVRLAWSPPAVAADVHPDQDGETRRLPRVDVGGASAAALGSIQVPVFRTEGERAMWAAERQIPPDMLPLQKRT